MEVPVAFLGPSGMERLATARKVLVPSENLRLVYQTREGFLMVTTRRITLLQEDKQQGYLIRQTMPLDSFNGIESIGSDGARINGANHPAMEVRASKRVKGEGKLDAKHRLHKAMMQIPETLAQLHTEPRIAPKTEYLDSIFEALTNNGILDLNTVLKDHPDNEALHHEPAQFLGEGYFVVEQCLRDGDNPENGVLFAAGLKGYYWIQGRKHGRFLQDVSVQQVEWDLITSVTQDAEGIIQLVYRLHEDGRELQQSFQWAPPMSESTIQLPWVSQKLNGLMILKDIISRYTGKVF